MPKSYKDATTEGLRRGLRNFIANFFGHLGKVAAYALLAVVVIFLVLMAVEWAWDGFTSPFRGAWSYVAGKYDSSIDWVTGWMPGGDTSVEVPTDIVEEVTPAETATEPGIICRNTNGWNPFCD